ncbi:MAG: RNA 2',3'-cyclic phosphodiesterase [Actinomycetota bacterium]|nr:RNA 2',3'-cyclic phosphodiesterase [Actinomycetota bacterium]
MRLFVALEVPDEVRGRLDAAVAPVRPRHPKLAWTSAEGWHLTLAFLGEVAAEPSDIAAVLAPVAADAPAAGIRLSLGQAGRFGRRVLWVGVRDEPAGAVAALGAGTQRALAEKDLPVDLKEVKPHLTVARARRGGGEVTASLVAAIPSVQSGWTAREVVLMRSVRLGQRRPNRYEPLRRLPLGG